MKATVTRLVRWIGIALGVVVGLAAVGLLLLTTEPGQRTLKDFTVSRINQGLTGKLSVDELELSGDEVTLKGVSLSGANEREILGVERLQLDANVPELLEGRIALEKLSVTGYRLRLRQQADGSWNLSRLFPPQPSKQEPDTLPSVSIDSLELRQGSIDVQLAGDEARHLHVEPLDIHGSLSLHNELLSGALTATGRVTQPKALPLDIQLRAQVDGGEQVVELAGSVGDARLDVALAAPDHVGLFGASLDQLAADVNLEVPSWQAHGHTYGPFDVQASWEQGQLQLTELEVELPGLRLERKPPQAETPVVLRAVAQVESLARTVRALEALTGSPLPAASGSGQLTLAVEPPVESPTVRLDGQFAALEASGVAASGASLEGRLQLDGTMDGKLTVRVDRLQAGEHQWQGLGLNVSRRSGQLLASIQVQEPYAASLRMSGELLDSATALRIDELEVAYPDTTWRSDSDPARLAWGAPGQDNAQSAIRLHDLDLTSGEQRIALNGSYQPEALHATLQLDDVRVDSIPEPLLDQQPALSALVNGRLQLDGSPEAPEASMQLDLAQLSVSGVGGLSASLEASYEGKRVDGELQLQGFGGFAQASFALPASLDSASGPIQGRLQVQGLRAGELWQANAGFLPASARQKVTELSGELSATARVDGTLSQPDIEANLRLHSATLALEGLDRYRDVNLVVQATRDRVHLRRFEAHAGQGRITAEGQAQRRGGEYDYELTFAARQMPVPANEGLLASLRGRAEGRAGADRVTSNISLQRSSVREKPPASDRSVAGLSQAGHSLNQETSRVQHERRAALLPSLE